MAAEIFLFVLAFVWLCVASFQDVGKREVANWLSFSMILFAMAFRAFYALFNNDLWFFLYGAIGVAIFFALANALYYSRLFAGGDAKLLMALGAVLPVFPSFLPNVIFVLLFIFGFFAFGSVYSLAFTAVLAARRRKEFAKQLKKEFKKNKRLFALAFIIAAITFVIVMISFSYLRLARQEAMLLFPLLFLILPFLYSYAKAVEETCMIKNVKASELVVGDWLYKPIRVGRKTIKPDWQGLDDREIKLLKKYKKNILVKQGVPFVPAFLIAFAAVVWLSYSGFFHLYLFF